MNKIKSDVLKRFDLSGHTAIITGGGGLLGVRHCEAIASAGGNPVIVDINAGDAQKSAESIEESFSISALSISADITLKDSWEDVLATALEKFGRVDILINNAANNPKVEKGSSRNLTRLENFPLEQWNNDFAVGVTGAFLGCQVVGKAMARQGKGVIINVASDLAVIAPNQRIYREDGVTDGMQNVKPVSYSVVKHALIGLTKYMATYWADSGVRVNAISPGGVYAGQDEAFVARLTKLIPMGRMAEKDEYKAAIIFLSSDASAYMNGHNLIMDGGRSIW